MRFLNFLKDWSEVWALLIPLLVILIFRPKGKLTSWLIAYVIIAALMNTISVFMVEDYSVLPSFLILDEGNNIYYNIHSFVMVICFSSYIISVRTYIYPKILKAVVIGYILFVIINFTFFESPFILSTLHFTVGSIVLLIMCLFYFFRSIVEDDSAVNWLRHPSFIICSGLCLYEVITFVIFLFIYPLFNNPKTASFAQIMMQVYQYIFVVFCILLAIGVYQHSRLDKKRAA